MSNGQVLDTTKQYIEWSDGMPRHLWFLTSQQAFHATCSGRSKEMIIAVAPFITRHQRLDLPSYYLVYFTLPLRTTTDLKPQVQEGTPRHTIIQDRKIVPNDDGFVLLRRVFPPQPSVYLVTATATVRRDAYKLSSSMALFTIHTPLPCTPTAVLA